MCHGYNHSSLHRKLSFFADIAKRYPHCAAKIFLPKNYLPIILLGIVQDNVHSVTTNFLVAFQFHLPYLTKDGSRTSVVVVTRPHVSVNMVLSLPLITATGVIINITDNAVDMKYLDCPPFLINFCRATKTLPAIDDNTTTHYVEFKDVHDILKKTNAFVAEVCNNFQLAKPNNVSNSETHRSVEARSNPNSVTTGRSIAT